MQVSNIIGIAWMGLVLTVSLPAGAETRVWTSMSSSPWSSTLSWLDGAVPSSGGADVRFNSSVVSGLVSTIDAAWCATGAVNSLTFLPGAQTLVNTGSFVLTNGSGVTSFTVGPGGISHQNGLNPVVVRSALTLGGDQAWVFVRPIMATGSLKTPVAYQPQLWFTNCVVNGSASSTVLTLNGNPPWSAANQPLGANVLLTGPAGGMGANIGRLNLKGSFVQLGASAADPNFNRIADNTALYSYGGGLYVFQQGSGTETFGNLRIESGGFSILGSTTGGSGTSIYKFNSLAARNNEGVLRLNSGTGNANYINFQFADVSGFGSGINGIVGGWAVAQTQQGGTYFMAPPVANTTMTTVAGVTATDSSTLNGYGSTDNVTFTGNSATNTADRSWNSLRTTYNGGTTLDLGGFTLRLTSGGVISDSPSGGSYFKNGKITAGVAPDTPATLYFQSRFGGSPIGIDNTAPITDNGVGQVNVIYAGDGGLDNLMGSDRTLTNSYTGFTGIYGTAFNSFQSAALSPGDRSAFGLVPASFVPDKIRISGGGLYANGNSTIHTNQGVQLSGAGLTVKWFSGALVINSAISGEGQLNLVMSELDLAGASANTYTGATVVAQGINNSYPPLLVLKKPGGVTSVPGDLFISARDGGWTGDAMVRLDASEQVADTSVVTLLRPNETSNGTARARFRLNGNSETIAGLMGYCGTNPVNAIVVENNHASAASTLTLKPATNAVYQYDGIIQNGSNGVLNLVMDGNSAGTQILGGSNTYSGATTLKGGALALGASERLPDTTKLILAGGTFATRGFSETLGTLVVSNGVSVLDFGSGSSIVTFAASSGETWTGILMLFNYTSPPDGGGTDRLFIGNSASGLTASQLARIEDSAGRKARQLSNGEIVFAAVGTTLLVY